MPDYRLYFLDDRGRIRRSFQFACDSDAAADEVAKDHRTGKPMELWQLDRCVAKYDRKDP